MLSSIAPEYVKQRVDRLRPWYHKIDLGNSIVTPGRDYDKIWDNSHSIIDSLDYSGSNVLDLGSWDGYWAFLAEAKGAKTVFATDCRIQGLENLLFCKSALESQVIPLFNVKVQDLSIRLDLRGFEEKFDFVHHLGLLYHLRDPYLSFSECRKIMNEGGYLILETACVVDSLRSFMFHNGTEDSYHFYGNSDVWAPSLLAIDEMLKRSMFEPDPISSWAIALKSPLRHGDDNLILARVTMKAKAVSSDKISKIDLAKLLVG